MGRAAWSFPAFLFLLIIGCDEKRPDVSGVWTGNTTAVVDAENQNIDLRLVLAQSEEAVTGSIRWGDVEEAISRSERTINEIIIVSEWKEGSITLRGRLIGDVMAGQFSYRYHTDDESFPASFEVTRE